MFMMMMMMMMILFRQSDHGRRIVNFPFLTAPFINIRTNLPCFTVEP